MSKEQWQPNVSTDIPKRELFRILVYRVIKTSKSGVFLSTAVDKVLRPLWLKRFSSQCQICFQSSRGNLWCSCWFGRMKRWVCRTLWPDTRRQLCRGGAGNCDENGRGLRWHDRQDRWLMPGKSTLRCWSWRTTRCISCEVAVSCYCSRLIVSMYHFDFSWMACWPTVRLQWLQWCCWVPMPWISMQPPRGWRHTGSKNAENGENLPKTWVSLLREKGKLRTS